MARAARTASRRKARPGRGADRTSRRSSAAERGGRILAVAGNLVGVAALAVAAGAVAWLLALTAGGDSVATMFEDDVAGTSTIAFPTLMLLLSMVAFFFGQYAWRGRWGVTPGSRAGGSFSVDLRPLGAGAHAVLLALPLVAWLLVMVMPVVRDAQGALRIPEGSSAAEQFWLTVSVYGVISGVLTAMVAVSLLKKLTFNRALTRHAAAIREGSRSQLWWRAFSHIWRAELAVAAFAGAALGLSPLGVHLHSPEFGWSAVGIGLGLIAVAVALALNAWRSGLPVERVESYT